MCIVGQPPNLAMGRLSREGRSLSRFSFCATNPLAEEGSLPARDGAPLRFSSKHAMSPALSAPLPLPAAVLEVLLLFLGSLERLALPLVARVLHDRSEHAAGPDLPS